MSRLQLEKEAKPKPGPFWPGSSPSSCYLQAKPLAASGSNSGTGSQASRASLEADVPISSWAVCASAERGVNNSVRLALSEPSNLEISCARAPKGQPGTAPSGPSLAPWHWGWATQHAPSDCGVREGARWPKDNQEGQDNGSWPQSKAHSLRRDTRAKSSPAQLNHLITTKHCAGCAEMADEAGHSWVSPEDEGSTRAAGKAPQGATIGTPAATLKSG